MTNDEANALPNETDEAKKPEQGELNATEGVHVPKDSGILGGKSSEGADMTTASGPSDSGGG